MPPAVPWIRPASPASRDWRRLPRSLLDLLLPRERALCAGVVAALAGARAARCGRCGLRSSGAPCPGCRRAGPSSPRALGCGDHAPPADRLVTAFTSGRRLALGRAVGAAMAMRLEADRCE